MAEPRRLSVLPPETDDDDRLRRALGQPDAVAPPATIAAPAARPAAAKVTVSVRMAPETQARLAAIGDAIGWSSNKIMTALVEAQAQVLAEAFARDGEAAILKILRNAR